MKLTNLKIPDVFIIEPDIFEDERGFFLESFNQKKFNDLIGQDIIFVQDNHSKSKKGVIRGLHYQDGPFAQDKLVRVINGEVYDVALDIRPESKTYGKWVSVVLSAVNKKQLWIPKGFAHGFLTLTKTAELLYKTTNFYSKNNEKIIHYKNNNFKIEWPRLDVPFLLSKKDNLENNIQ